jgi:hypothetical protein
MPPLFVSLHPGRLGSFAAMYSAADFVALWCRAHHEYWLGTFPAAVALGLQIAWPLWPLIGQQLHNQACSTVARQDVLLSVEFKSNDSQIHGPCLYDCNW